MIPSVGLSTDRKPSLDAVTREVRSLSCRPKPDLPFFSEIDYKGKFLVKCFQQDVDKDVTLRRTDRADPMEASYSYR